MAVESISGISIVHPSVLDRMSGAIQRGSSARYLPCVLGALFGFSIVGGVIRWEYDQVQSNRQLIQSMENDLPVIVFKSSNGSCLPARR